jgi:hypothetical protein
METIKYINQYGLAKLLTEYAIKVNENPEYGLYVLNYDQIDSPKNHPITNECRSLVVTCDFGIWKVISRSFDRFFNYGEIDGDKHDITKMVAYEKVDGSIVSLFYWNGEWLYRTRSMIMPTSQVNGWDKTWKELIEPVLLDKGFREYNHNTNLTYIFEVVGTENRVVTRYEESAAYLLAIRDNQTGNYSWMDKEDILLRGWKLPMQYSFNTIDHCLQAAKDLRDLNEGYVLYDHFGVPKIKVKNPAYVAAHLLRGEGLNPKRIMQLVFMNEVAEYLSIFPEDKVHFEPYTSAAYTLEQEINTKYWTANLIESQKDFALEVKDLCYSGVLFSARKQNKNPIDVLHSMDESYKIKLLTQYMGEK